MRVPTFVCVADAAEKESFARLLFHIRLGGGLVGCVFPHLTWQMAGDARHLGRVCLHVPHQYAPSVRCVAMRCHALPCVQCGEPAVAFWGTDWVEIGDGMCVVLRFILGLPALVARIGGGRCRPHPLTREPDAACCSKTLCNGANHHARSHGRMVACAAPFEQ